MWPLQTGFIMMMMRHQAYKLFKLYKQLMLILGLKNSRVFTPYVSSYGTKNLKKIQKIF